MMHLIRIEIQGKDPVYVIGPDRDGDVLSDELLKVMEDTNLPTISEDEMQKMISEVFGAGMMDTNGVVLVKK